MRAIYLPHTATEKVIELSGDKLHHLVHVVRIEQGEELLLLDGKGTRTLTVVKEFSKKTMRLEVKSSAISNDSHKLHLALGIPKKEALELALKHATELGVRKIFLVRAEYSQTKVPEAERLHSILESALEQANAPFLPEIVTCNWGQLPWGDYQSAVLMNSQQNQPQEASELRRSSQVLLIVGPEGGFSPQELNDFHTNKKIINLQLETPILRTPTAVATGLGFLLGRLLD